MIDKYDVLSRYFGYSAFREGQETLIDAILAGRDALGVMPTGAGKSICYQVPAMMLDGITLVISPLISLMRDQVLSLVQSGVPAAYLNSSLSYKQFLEALRRMEAGQYKLVYVAPERLSLPRFQELCGRLPISFIAVDEAHCISQWGQDFRPDYLKIPEFLERLSTRPVLGAFTATATDRVRADIMNGLGLLDPFTLTTGFDRPNLFFAVRAPKDKNSALLRELAKQKDRSGIIYCATRKKVEAVCSMLCAEGYAATMYHAGLEPEVRAANQEDFLFDRKPVMVATNAFGMGIDKSNVSFVIHYNMPKSVEAYYQEAGRAGRDGEPADCTLLYAPGDVETQQFLIEHSEPNPELSEEEQLEAKKQDYIRLAQMKSYAVESSCLRAYILRYFGETPRAHCDHCSNCLESGDFADITVDAQKILSCVKRSGERFGLAMIAHILHGDREERIERNGLDTLPTFGIMRELSVAGIRRCIRALIDQDYLQEKGEYRILSLRESAWDVLRGEQTVHMRADRKSSSSGKQKAAAENPILFEKLRQLRMELAKYEHVAAFTIFSDATLRDMCAKLPVTMEEFLDIAGVGKTKAKKYGERFISLIQREIHPVRLRVLLDDYVIGAAVYHEAYGEGRIIRRSEDRLTVRFLDGRIRRLLFPDCVERQIVTLL